MYEDMSMEELEKLLTRKERLFVEEYDRDGNGTQAAIRAGYAESSARSMASKLLANHNIAARVRLLQKEQADRLQLSADVVVVKLFETLSMCMQAVPVMIWDPAERKMVESGQYSFDSKGATKCLELIGKHLGMFTDKVQVSGSVNAGLERLDSVMQQLRGGGDGG